MIGSVATEITAIAGSTASAAAPAIAASTGATGAWGAAVAVPVIGAAVAGVTLALTAFFNRKGPRQKVAATQIVDELEPLLARNVEEYLHGPRTADLQVLALANFDSAWNYLRSGEACGSPELGDPGRRCISERDRGGRWDWFDLYRDPIANDTPRPDAAESILASITGDGPELGRFGLIAGLALLGAAFAL